MKKLYLFDFDGTLTYKDTMFMYLKFYNPSKFNIQFIKHIPLFVLLKLKLADAEKVKKSFISSILKGERKAKIERKSQAFFEKYDPELFRENALEFIKNIDRKNTDSYIVSASLDIWVKPFAEKLNIKLLSTRAEFEDDIFTGNFIGRNCNGAEKVNRIKEEIGDKKYDKTIAFGDTSGDKEMLAWANEGQFEFFH
ncbi:HAD family hydrolase [Kaistella jeonii]|uniref:HAD family hydrolase n=1 Tax=Kaistella jeonii TaxID=266749 RepID=A0A0C1F8V4_9FLAO|nr:HAD family hydrolase [Kaistella jeonii]KIA88333.1 HAD family hydrolase [Kaistella jeonii]SFC23633.1 HAD-superfamily subfamily IB hydrolase, TIGR01490 [Kaistella jeonii]VEI94568.1 2-hydroxy-3-keto-5-methylthiopentenyl-1-phosphatephosphatase [Kaistella jeonii]